MRAVSAIIALIALVAAPARASDPVRLVTGPNYAPYVTPDLPDGGLLTHLVRRVYARMDKEVRVRRVPWKRTYRAVESGRFTAALGYVPSPERRERFRFSAPLLRVTIKAMVPESSAMTASTPADLAGLRYCVPRGWKDPAPIAELHTRGALDRLTPPRLNDCFRMLKRGAQAETERGAPDFLAVEVALGRYHARNVAAAPDSVRFLDVTLGRPTLHAIFPRGATGSEAARRRFDRHLTAMRESGELARIRERYIDAHLTRPLRQ